MSYDFPAWCQMQTVLDQYEQAREENLRQWATEHGPEGERRLRRLTNAADSLMRGIEQLAELDILDGLSDLSQAGGLNKDGCELFFEHVCIKFGWEVMGMLDLARERFHDLLLLLEDRNPGRDARRFLLRVSRCYLFGFDTECVVMCRAALDREFDGIVSDDDHVSEWWKWYATTPEARRYWDSKPPYRQLWAKIEAALYAGMIDESEHDAADFVRDRGNEAVHRRPNGESALEVIRETLRVLDALERPR